MAATRFTRATRHLRCAQFSIPGAALWESVIAIFFDGNTEAAFSAEFVIALGKEIRMGFVPISICCRR